MNQKAPENSARGDPEGPKDLPWIRLRLAQAALFWERLWPALWPAVLTAGLFLALALLDILPALPAWLHAALLLGFAGLFLYVLWRGVTGLRRPDLGAAARRLERDGGVQHRPLAALFDRPAGLADAAGSSLWRAHRQRLVADLARLRLLPPRAGLARRDPWGLRAALVLVLVIAAAAAGTDWRGRLADAATPDLAGWGRGMPPVLDLWVTPPDYTGAPPTVLSAGAPPAGQAATAEAPGATSPATSQPLDQPPLTVPEGSKVVAQLQGGRGTAILVLGDRAAPFTESEPRAQRAEGIIMTGDLLAVTQDGDTIAEWPLVVTPDDAPTIAFAEPPSATERAALHLSYEAGDDYGVAAVTAVIQRTDRQPAPDGSERIELPLPLSGTAKAARGGSYHDLAPHPWAGLPVDIHLEARDALGQQGQSETVSAILPERVFNHPVARAIIAERKKLILDPTDRRSAARNLAAIGSIPEAFDNDTVVSLALRSALRRLVLNREAEVIGEVVELLWDTALRVEDGGLAVAERELRAAQEALQEALAGDASDAEIDRLMDELQRALEKFMAALAEQMMKSAENGAMQPMDPNAQMLRPQDFQDLVERAREMAKTGAREAAADLLAQLQQMLENLQAGQPMMGEGQSEAMEMLRDLDELSRRQQELLDKSFRQSQQGQGEPQQGQQQGQGQPGQSEPGQQAPGQQGGQPGGQQGDAAMQEALRQGLGELMRRFGEMTGDIPYPLGRAEREMKNAVDALRQDGPGQAIGPQTRALEELQQAGRAMAEQLMQQLGNQPGNGEGQQQQFGRNRDPLGRTESGNGAIDTGDVELPEEADIQRSREILDELHRRAGERQRPRIEQDYIDRLLRRF